MSYKMNRGQRIRRVVATVFCAAAISSPFLNLAHLTPVDALNYLHNVSANETNNGIVAKKLPLEDDKAYYEKRLNDSKEVLESWGMDLTRIDDYKMLYDYEWSNKNSGFPIIGKDSGKWEITGRGTDEYHAYQGVKEGHIPITSPFTLIDVTADNPIINTPNVRGVDKLNYILQYKNSLQKLEGIDAGLNALPSFVAKKSVPQQKRDAAQAGATVAAIGTAIALYANERSKNKRLANKIREQKKIINGGTPPQKPGGPNLPTGFNGRR